MLIQDIVPPEQLVLLKQIYFRTPLATTAKMAKAKHPHHIKVH